MNYFKVNQTEVGDLKSNIGDHLDMCPFQLYKLLIHKNISQAGKADKIVQQFFDFLSLKDHH